MKRATASDIESKEGRDWAIASERLQKASLALNRANSEFVMAQAQCYQALTRWESVLQSGKKRKA